jgi:molybdopterin-guanine dinucleotide biosynthesis protein A
VTEPGVSAIVLAGGRSSRFGRDKLAEPIDGRSLLEHAIATVRPFASEILVVVAPDGNRAVSPGVVVVHDPERFEGPLMGLLAGLTAAREPAALVTAGDMPGLMPRIVDILLAGLDFAGTQAVVLGQDGRARPLPMAVRRIPAQAAAARLIEAGERRLGALVEALTTTVIDEATWRAVDPEARSTRDIDTPGDLA